MTSVSISVAQGLPSTFGKTLTLTFSKDAESNDRALTALASHAHLKSLSIHDLPETDVLAEVLEAHPSLTSLSFFSSRLSPPAVSALKHLKHLTYLRFLRCALPDFPIAALKMKALRNVDLKFNKLEFIPPELALLDALQSIELQGNPISLKKSNKIGELVVKQIASFADEPPAKRVLQMKLALAEHQATVIEASIAELAPMLELTLRIRGRAYEALSHKIKDPFSEEPKDARLSLIGRAPQLALRATNKSLAAFGAKLVKGLHDKTTHVVVGEQPGEALPEALGRGLILSLPAHVQKLLDGSAPPLLRDPEVGKEASGSAEELLSSPSDASVRLGLELCAANGVSESVYPTLLALSRTHVDTKLRKRATDVLKKGAPAALHTRVLAVLGRANLRTGKDDTATGHFTNLLAVEGFDARGFALRCALRSGIGVGFLMTQGGDAARTLMNTLTQDGELVLTGSISSLPPEIGSLKGLRSLIVSSDQGSRKIKTLPPEFVQLTVLENLSLNGQSFRAVPEEVLALKRLRSLSLVMNNMRKLNGIERLEALKVLRLQYNGLTLKSFPKELAKTTGLTIHLTQQKDMQKPQQAELAAKFPNVTFDIS